MPIPLETVLRLDDAEYNRRLDRADQKANIFAKKFQSSFLKMATSFASVGFLTSFVRNLITSRDEIAGLGDDTSKALGKMESGWKAVSNAIKLTAAQAFASGTAQKSFMGRMVQLITKPFSGIGMGLEGLGERFGTEVTNQKEADAAVIQGANARKARDELIKKMREQASSLAQENHMAGLTTEQRKKELQLRLEALRKADIRGLNVFGRLENAIEREQIKAQLMGMEKKPPSLSKPNFGALTEIGGVLGRTDNLRIQKVQEESVKILKQVSKNTGRTTQILEGQ